MAALGVIFQAQRGNSTALCRIVLFECSIFDVGRLSYTRGSRSVCLSVCGGVMLEEKAAPRAPSFGRTLSLAVA